MSESTYLGGELDVFSTASNWKAYWLNEIKPFLGTHILEIGAGIGATAKNLNFKTYKSWIALEPDTTFCALIEKGMIETKDFPPNMIVLNETSENFSREGKFDTVLYIDVLEHIENDKDELIRISKLLIDGGNIVIVAPAHNFLFTAFDEKVGHFRRYNRNSLKAIIPSNMTVKKMRYLDSVGLIASLANKLFLKSSEPTLAQIQLWDRLMVRLSRLVDVLFGFMLGKSIVCILQKTGE